MKKSFRNTIRVSNSLDPDQALGHRSSADDTIIEGKMFKNKMVKMNQNRSHEIVNGAVT